MEGRFAIADCIKATEEESATSEWRSSQARWQTLRESFFLDCGDKRSAAPVLGGVGSVHEAMDYH
jgi:hypothetical protein